MSEEYIKLTAEEHHALAMPLIQSGVDEWLALATVLSEFEAAQERIITAGHSPENVLKKIEEEAESGSGGGDLIPDYKPRTFSYRYKPKQTNEYPYIEPFDFDIDD